ncbi:MAG: 3-deoxy-7-phosphoheptulonate synthase [Kiritimatiellales bacterium]
MNDPSTLENLHVVSLEKIAAPQEIKTDLPLTDKQRSVVLRSRKTIRDIMYRRDPRLLTIAGPCSIHDPDAALDYACRLAKLAPSVSDRLFIVMRVYFEKPRTTIGWKGFINDPHRDRSYDMNYGLRAARQLMCAITDIGLPVATEFLDPVIPQYIGDLVSWAAIGARTVESQTHREIVSGLSMPVGLKNATSGSIQSAIDAQETCRTPHSFLGIDQNGSVSLIKTSGNPDVHLVLRGGGGKSNYSPEEIAATAAKLRAGGFPETIMVDCSHANSNKTPERQADVWKSILAQRKLPDCPIIGAMIESFIGAGNQPVEAACRYGVSVTDPCMDWTSTRTLLETES